MPIWPPVPIGPGCGAPLVMYGCPWGTETDTSGTPSVKTQDNNPLNYLFIFLFKADVEPERHSLYYVYIALSQQIPAPGIFEFTAMGLLDDRKIDYYNSMDKVKIPQQDWMREKIPADYWERGTQKRKSKEEWFKVNINTVMERMRHNTSDIHSLMWRHGCEAVRTADGSLQFVKGVDEYSYDGIDFLSFDDDSLQWVAPVPEAFLTKHNWEGVPFLHLHTKSYLEKECVEWLDKFRTYGDSELTENQKHYPPQIHLFARNGRPHGRYLLTCLATGFYPKDIKISILKNDWPEKDGHPSDVLPNGDGTHQIRVTIIAEKDEINMYRCKIEHRTLDKPIIVGEVLIEEPSMIIGIVGGVLLLITGVVVIIGRNRGWFTMDQDTEEDVESVDQDQDKPVSS
ncbi:class I histocompatibility antigen, F10 alpha chain-like [Engraulis encrasicolus]|uniref:class I histocompatibility antigen, F10 alpha chain-like n=1 Tax=Engraulis encrasicolus TaxID=184585 RepID=UPI002FD3B25B